MKMTPRNIIIFAIALIVGLYLGLQYPLFGAVMIVPLIIFVVVVLMRNKSGALADPSTMADALQFTAPPSKARIYIRRKGFVGGQQGMNVTIDDRLNSQIRSKYFLMAEVDPGTHKVAAQMASGTKSAETTIDVTVQAGECVLLDVKFDMGLLQGKPTFEDIREAIPARKMLSGCRLVLWKP